MFSGIVKEVGVVRSVRDLDGVREIRIGASAVLDGLEAGASISLDGACHTAVSVEGGAFTVHSIGTTQDRTVSGTYGEGSLVNLERSLLVGERLDGHLVQGHVDGVGELVAVAQQGHYHLLDVRIPSHVARQTLLHGSIAINGVSLTVHALGKDDVCRVAVVPYTRRHTNLGALALGDPVNVEGDMIGKYVKKMLPDGP